MAARARSLRLRLLLPVLIVGVAILALVLIRQQMSRVPPADLFPSHELRVGVDPGNPPFAAFDGSGSLFGMEIDLARALGERLGLPVRFVALGYDGLYDALKADQVDALIAGLTVDLSRLDDVHYSQPYFNAGLVLVSEDGLTRMEDMPGKRLAYEFGSEADTEARAWLRRVLPFETRPYETTDAALDAVRVGDADAALVDAASARLYGRSHADWSATITTVTDNLYAIATQSRHPEISVAISEALQAMIDDGALDALLRRWL